MEESAQGSKRVLAGLKSHKLNSLNGLLTHGTRPRNGHDGATPAPDTNRLDVIKAYAADCALAPDGAGEDATATDTSVSQIAQRFAPRPGSFPPPDEDRIAAAPLAPPLLALASGVRTLAAALIAVALLPNLVLAGLIWYGGVEPRWPSVTETPPAVEVRAPAVHSVLTVPIPMPTFAREPADDGGEVTAALPANAAAEPSASEAMPLPAEPGGEAIHEKAEQLAAIGTDEAPQEAALSAPSESVPLPTRRPAPPSADDADASWVKPTAFVNLRSAPASRASVVAVIAKGTKLRVVARKRGWVQATEPTTDKTGWVYSGNVVAAR